MNSFLEKKRAGRRREKVDYLILLIGTALHELGVLMYV